MPWLMIAALLLVLVLAGAGFAVKILWLLAVVLLVLWLLGFVARGTGPSGGRARWYRW